MSKLPYKVKAIFEYDSPHDDDLSFPISQIISITEEVDEDWYQGEYIDDAGVKKEGLFPRNFVERYEPETPPRPVRSGRPKKEPEAVPEAASNEVEGSEDMTTQTKALPLEIPPSPTKPIDSVSSPTNIKTTSPVISAAPAQSAPPSKPKGASKGPPPAVAEKPSGGSFRDRIAAFNKPAAPPVAPFKPGGTSGGSGSGFIKKPFVAPPPSKDAYVPPPREPPPQKLYRREEDPDLTRGNEDGPTERPAPVTTSATADDEGENQPKPTSLKDRIALLQKQQLEQAARQADAASRKEKPKRPAKPRAESSEQALDDSADAGDLQKINSEDTIEASGSPAEPDAPRLSRRKPSREAHGSTPVISRDFQSDANDADQSAAGETTEDAEDGSTGRDDSDTKPSLGERTRAPPPPARAAAPPAQEPDVEDGEDGTEGEEEEEVDPEVKRRMEIRERMAKMSGGMGMAGMFGPPGGMPGMGAAPKKKKATVEQPRAVEEDVSKVERAPPVPIMPMHGRASTTGSGASVISPTSEKDFGQKERHHGAPNEEDEESEEDLPIKQPERGHPLPPVPQASHPSSSKPIAERAVPPPPPTQTRPLPQAPAPPARPISQDSDDEEENDDAARPQRTSRKLDDTSPTEAPPLPIGGAPSLPSRSIPNPASKSERRDVSTAAASSPTELPKRSSFVPPIPGAVSAPMPHSQSRAPPPPPPSAPGASLSRKSTGDHRSVSSPKQLDESEREYEGDYDTDIASGATHKEALKSHMREPSLDESTTADDTPVRSPVNSPPVIPRAVPPPPPPGQAQRTGRQSMDTPRAPPPPPPPNARDTSKGTEESEYDPYRYSGSKFSAPPPPIATDSRREEAYDQEDSDQDLYNASPREPRTMTGIIPASQHQPQQSKQQLPPPPPPPSQQPTRQSLDAPRKSTSSRRSTDQPRMSSDHHSIIATDIDLSPSSLWWTQDGQPAPLPPQLQSRVGDFLVEVDSSTTTQRGGKSTISKDIYILFSDYSQTVITVRFDPANPGPTAALSQRHEPPPPPLRKDQLEQAATAYGARLATIVATTRVNQPAVGDGSAIALVRDLISSISPSSSSSTSTATEAPLAPIGRSSSTATAFGIPVYMNLANASISQADEIRAGDIIVFRKARFQGHRGPVHKAYSIEVGGSGGSGSGAGTKAKGEHVGIVMDWDGTKRKVRCWEQGRDFDGGEDGAGASKKDKVKLESYKLGDLKSGEVKVWRVVGRSWVGWEG